MAKPPFPFFVFWISTVMHNPFNHSAVIPALGAGIHALGLEDRKAWIPEPSSGMTTQVGSNAGARS